MDDKKLDELIASTLPPEPPDEVARGVTPWQNSMRLILWGLGLCSVTFNFSGLNLILPSVGVLLMLLGFRRLRRANACFMACYVITALKQLLCILMLVMNSTVFANAPEVTELWDAITLPNTALTLLNSLLLWGGIRKVQQRAGVPVHAGAAAALVVWQALVLALSMIGAVLGIIFAVLMLVFLGLVISSLYKLSRELDEAGYVIKAAPGLVPDTVLGACIAALTLALMLCGYLFLSKYPMDWSEPETGGESGTRALLTELGFPEDILADISDEDVAECAGAKRVETVSVDGWGVDVQMVAVELPDRFGHWLTFHYFRLQDGLDYRTTEGIRLFSSYATDPAEGFWLQSGPVTGRVLYDGDSGTLSAPFARILDGAYTDTIIWGVQYNPTTYVEFSLPRQAQCVRGYVMHDMTSMRSYNGGVFIDSYLEFYHRDAVPTFPSKTAIDLYLKDGWQEHTQRMFMDYLDIYIEDYWEQFSNEGVG